MTDLLLVIDGQRAIAAHSGADRPEIATRYPGVPNAGRAGWQAMIDLRGVEGPITTLTLLARARGRDWVEIGRSETRVEEPHALSGGRNAVFTIVQDEARFLSIWLRYYSRHFDRSDIYVLDHDTTDGSTDEIGDSCNVVAVHRETSFDQVWLKGTVEDFQSFLLRSYDAVLYAEADEFVVPNPSRYADLAAYIEELEGSAACCTGYNVVHYPDEPPLRFDEPVLAQRKYWYSSSPYSKRLLSKVPLSWNVGFHQELNVPSALPDPDLYLVHLHRVDYEYCLARHRRAVGRKWNEGDLLFNLTWHQRVVEPTEFHEWFFHGPDLEGGAEAIPEHIKSAL